MSREHYFIKVICISFLLATTFSVSLNAEPRTIKKKCKVVTFDNRIIRTKNITISEESLIVADGKTGSEKLPLESIKSIFVSSGLSILPVLATTATGFGGGVPVGIAIGELYYRNPPPSYSILGGVIGAATGFAIGFFAANFVLKKPPELVYYLGEWKNEDYAP